MTPLRLFDSDAEPSGPLTIGDGISLYLAHRKALIRFGKSEASYKDAERYLLNFSGHFGSLFLSQADEDQEFAWLIANPSWKSPHSKADAIKFLVGCFRWLEKKKHVIECPYRRLTDELEEALPRKAITRSDYKALMLSARKSGYKKTRWAFRAIIMFLWRTGARPCEAREAKISDLDWTRGVIELVKNKTSKKTGTRIIPVRHVCGILRLAIGKRTEGPIFLNSQGRAWTRGGLADVFRAYADRAKLSKALSSYCLRHGFMTEGVEAGIPDFQLAQIAGHKGTRYLSWYTRSSSKNADHLNNVAGQVHRRKPKHP